MKKLLTLGLAVPMAVLMACSSDDHSSTAPEDDDQISSSSFTEEDLDKLLGNSSSSAKVTSSSSEKLSSGDKPTSSSSGKSSSSVKDESSSSTIVVESCDDVLDETGKMALDLVHSKSAKLFEMFADGDMEAAKALAKEVKPMYKKILDKYPGACGAQVGYAFATVGDLGNNENLKIIWDDYYGSFRHGVNDVGEFVDIVTKLSKGKKSFTQRVQFALTDEVLPALDSSIVYLQNVLENEDYALQLNDAGTMRELDKSEFGLALGGLFAAKAAVAIATSMNLEMAYNGSYSWMNNVEDLRLNDEKMSKSQTEAVKALVSLLGAKGTFTTVIKGKETLWKSVPALIDSAITESRGSFQYSIDESKVEGSQEFDLYVVGDGYDADLSVDEVQDMIDALDTALKVVRGPYEVEIRGTKLVFDARKYFENTDGIEAFLPYYVFEDESDFSTFYFTDAKGKKTKSLLDFVDGDLSVLDDGDGVIVFKDPTFGGVFPNFKKQSDVWEFLNAISEEEEEDDWDYGPIPLED